jgi:hypothetical protein
MSEQITVTVVDKRPAVIEGNLEIIPFPDLVAGKVLGNDGSKLLWQDAGAGGGVWGSIGGTLSDQTDLQIALNGKAALVHSHAIADVSGLQTALDGKAALSHTHAIADVTGLQAELDGKAALSHSHVISDVTGLQSALDGKAALSHTHGLDALILGGTAGQAVVSGGAGAATLFAPPSGRVIFSDAGGVLSNSPNLTWDQSAGILKVIGQSGGGFKLGELSSQYGAIYGANITNPGVTNYSWFCKVDGAVSVFNATQSGPGWGISFRILNSNRMTVGTAAHVHIAAGTSSPNTAPLKFTAGTNLTNPEDGAMEYDGTNLYFTVGGVRKTVVLS